MKKILFFAAVALTFAACDDTQDNPPVSQVAAKIYATIGESTVTRATDSSWTKGDSIGISSIVGGLNTPYINVKYTTEDGDGNFTGRQIYFYKPMTLTAYYPFTGVQGKAPGVDGVIAASTVGENQTPKNQPKIDFLWDSQTGFKVADPNVYFKFYHKMSKITFTFQSSDPVYDQDDVKLADGVNVRDMISYNIAGLGVEGTFNTVTGVCSIDESKHDGLEITFEKENDEMKERSFPSLIVFPQSLKDGSVTLNITTDELNKPDALQHYHCNLSFSNGEIVAGYHYIYTVKVTKIGLIVGKMTVEPWVVENRYMTATIDGEKVFDEKN